MAKSNRQRKRDRAARQAKAARKQRAVQRERLFQMAAEEARQRLDAMYDPATPAEELTRLLAEHYDGAPTLPGMTELLLSKGTTPERLAEVSGLLRAAQAREVQPSLTYLTFAAGAARAAGDAGQARRLLDDALRQAEDPDTKLRLVAHLRVHGRFAEAIEPLESALREDPADATAARHYGTTIEAISGRLAGGEASGECPCASGRPWPECCGPRERAALDRFRDQAGLTALRDALAAYLPASGYAEAVRDFIDERLSLAGADEWETAERGQFAALASELSLVLAGPDQEVAAGPDDADDDGARVLTAFAADPGVPSALAANARAWRDHIHYGLWQIAEPDPSPGVWCTDVVTGVTRYAAFPPELISRFPRWGVLLGGLVPADGIWRSTGQALRLSPEEADALAETVTDATEVLVRDLAGKQAKPAARNTPRPVPFGRAEPHNVLAYHADELSDDAARVIGMVTSSLLLRLAAEVHDQRVMPPAMTNTDGDPMCLVKARIAVRDVGTLAARLEGNRDFTRDPEDPARLVWLGRAIPENQRLAMMAEVRAQLGAGHADSGAELSGEGPQRWIRGQLQIRDGELAVEVNSTQRLARLVALLDELGEAPSVVDESRVDPAQDMAWPTGPRVFPRGAAPPADGWEKHWLDEQVPALRGRTPRQAAHSPDWPRLEALLRQFEYDADLLAAEGKSGIDTAWLRQELDMPDDPWE
jgi:tetratricopeptide (TPR) repeat protein